MIEKRKEIFVEDPFAEANNNAIPETPKKFNELMVTARATRTSRLRAIEENEDDEDDFYDARGDEETL